METVAKIRDPDVKPRAFPLPNGEAKKPSQEPEQVIYRECLKNHAASLGGHALDGCGEFMPSLTANPAEPTSLKCAACGCHRNFHRRIGLRNKDDVLEGEGEREGHDDDDGEDSRQRSLSSPTPPPPYFSSIPDMLLALRDGNPTPVVVSAAPLRKRFRSKFSVEQKEKMMELSERLGWRLQRRDEELVEKCCNEIGVGKGVFKVWMHNNKYHLFGHSRRGEMGSGVSPSAAAAGARKVDENGGC